MGHHIPEQSASNVLQQIRDAHRDLAASLQNVEMLPMTGANDEDAYLEVDPVKEIIRQGRSLLDRSVRAGGDAWALGDFLVNLTSHCRSHDEFTERILDIDKFCSALHSILDANSLLQLVAEQGDADGQPQQQHLNLV